MRATGAGDVDNVNASRNKSDYYFDGGHYIERTIDGHKEATL